MLKIIFSTFLMVFCFSSLFAQITIETEQDSDRNVLFYAISPTKIPYSVATDKGNLEIKELSDFNVTHPLEVVTLELNKKELKIIGSK